MEMNISRILLSFSRSAWTLNLSQFPQRGGEPVPILGDNDDSKNYHD